MSEPGADMTNRRKTSESYTKCSIVNLVENIY